jgi:hypothetical protein
LDLTYRLVFLRLFIISVATRIAPVRFRIRNHVSTVQWRYREVLRLANEHPAQPYVIFCGKRERNMFWFQIGSRDNVFFMSSDDLL